MADYKTFENEYDCLRDLRDKDSQGAFKAIYSHYSERLFLFAMKLLKNDEIAQEVVHEVFCKIWEGRKNLNLDLSFNSYIHTICKNQIYKMFKKAARQEELRAEILESARFAHNELEDNYLFDEYRKVATNAIAQLPPKRKLVYNICKIEGKSYEEAARELQISKNAVKDHMVKAAKFVREYFELRTGVSL